MKLERKTVSVIIIAIFVVALLWLYARLNANDVGEVYAEAEIESNVQEPTPTPTPTSTPMPTPTPTTEPKYVIVLDPGHGGNDYGAPIGRINEKDIVLSIAEKIYELFSAEAEYKVYMTRYEDIYVTLDDRIAMAGELSADMMISIHANFNDEKSIGGTETYSSENAWEIGEIIHNSLMSHIDSRDRGLRGDNNYYILVNSEVPTLLIETGFMSNPNELEKLLSEEYQEKIAIGIYEGIKESAIKINVLP